MATVLILLLTIQPGAIKPGAEDRRDAHVRPHPNRPPAANSALRSRFSSRPFSCPICPRSPFALSCSFAPRKRSTSRLFSIASTLFCETPGASSRAFLHSKLSNVPSANSFRISTYRQTLCFTRFWPQSSASKSFRIRTYTESRCNPFRIRTYEKTGGWGPLCQPAHPIGRSRPPALDYQLSATGPRSARSPSQPSTCILGSF